MSEPQRPLLPTRKRSGSERRQRVSVISVRVYDTERATIAANAAAAALSASAFLRALGTGKQRSHERRPPPANAELLAKSLAHVGRIGGNLAQFLKLVNRGDVVSAQDLALAVREARAFIAEARRALGG